MCRPVGEIRYSCGQDRSRAELRPRRSTRPHMNLSLSWQRLKQSTSPVVSMMPVESNVIDRGPFVRTHCSFDFKRVFRLEQAEPVRPSAKPAHHPSRRTPKIGSLGSQQLHTWPIKLRSRQPRDSEFRFLRPSFRRSGNRTFGRREACRREA